MPIDGVETPGYDQPSLTEPGGSAIRAQDAGQPGGVSPRGLWFGELFSAGRVRAPAWRW